MKVASKFHQTCRWLTIDVLAMEHFWFTIPDILWAFTLLCMK